MWHVWQYAVCDTGVCEINAHLDGAGFVNVPKRACAPMGQRARAALIKTVLAHPIPLNRVPIGQNTLKSKFDNNFAHAECWHVQAQAKSKMLPTLTTSRMSIYFTDTGITGRVLPYHATS